MVKNKGFTLLELVVVILIVGVLATLGFTQYGRMVERARGAEARQNIGYMRKLAAAYRLQNGSVTNIGYSDVNVGRVGMVIRVNGDAPPGTTLTL